MKLITEEINLDQVEFITEEDTTGKKSMYIHGIFMQGDIVNRNNRMYPMETVLVPATEKYIKESVENKRAFGEMNHPNGPTINLDRVSHMVTSLKREGKNYIGKAKILETPMGQIARNLIEGGGNLGVSSRAVGSVKDRNGINEVQNNLVIFAAADLVATPSAPNAYVNGIMEGFEWKLDPKTGEWVSEYIEEEKKQLKTLTVEQIEEQKVVRFGKFLDNLSKSLLS